MGRTWCGHAGIGRILPLPERNLWSPETGTPDFFPLHMAALVQRAAIDRVGRDWTVAVRGVLLAEPGKDLVYANRCTAPPLAGNVAGDLGCDASHPARNLYLCLNGIFAVSKNYGHHSPDQTTVDGCDGHDRVDHFRRTHPFQCAAGL